MQHKDRLAAHKELHARPFPLMNFDAHLTQLCVKATAKSIPDVWAWLEQQVVDLPKAPVAWQSEGDYWIRVEPHTEFLSVLWLSSEPMTLDPTWLAESPTAVLVLSAFAPADKALVSSRPVVSALFDGQLTAGSDFVMGPDGVTRWSYHFADAPEPESRGKALQMLVEVETYRILALVRMDQIRAVHPLLQEISVTAGDIRLRGQGGAPLDQLEACEAQLDELWQQVNWRIGACRAYYDLVFQRLEDLGEQSLAARTSIGRFMGRRMTPAVRTAETILKRQQELATQVSHKANLLRTRMQLELQEQHAYQVARQTRLQSTVEGLSVVAISYYALGLVSSAVMPWVPLDAASWVKALLVPVVVLAVWAILKRIKTQL